MLDIAYTKMFKSFFRGVSGNNDLKPETLYFTGVSGVLFLI